MSKAKNYYDEEFLAKQQLYYANWPEKQRRHFVALEYERLGVGSKRYVARVFGCQRQAIKRGLQELAAQN